MLQSPGEYAMEIARNLKRLRRREKLTQTALAAKAGVSYASLRRFERTGEISLGSLLRIAVVLGAAEPFGDLFRAPEITSIREIIDGEA